MGGGGDLDHKIVFFIEVELSIKHFGIKPRLEGGSSALKLLLHVRKAVIFFKKCLLPPLTNDFPYNSCLSSSTKVTLETFLHQNFSTKTSQKLAFFSDIGRFYAA